jgi:hypothetical protein
MRAVLITLMMIAVIQGAVAQGDQPQTDPSAHGGVAEGSNGTSNGPATQGAIGQSEQTQTEPTQQPNAEVQSDSQLLTNIREFATKLGEAGYQEVEPVLQGILIKAKDKSGKRVMMLFDPANRIAMQVGISESETTGSGSSDEQRQ